MGYTPKYLGHVNIYVRNAEKPHKWYEDILRLHAYDLVPGRAAFMSADKDQSHEVALMEAGDNSPSAQKGQVGLNHMAWRMENLDDLKAFYAHIKDRGVQFHVAATESPWDSTSRTPTTTASKSTTKPPAGNGTARKSSSSTATVPPASSPDPGTKCSITDPAQPARSTNVRAGSLRPAPPRCAFRRRNPRRVLLPPRPPPPPPSVPAGRRSPLFLPHQLCTGNPWRKL